MMEMQAIRPNPMNRNLMVINHSDSSDLMINHSSGAEQLNPNAKLITDINIAQTFGASLFNLQDPYYLQHRNIPRKLNNSSHGCTLVVNLYLIVSIAVGAALLVLRVIDTSPIAVPVIIMVQGYIIYALVAILCSQTRGYIMNVKPFSLY
jgi:hypothetical protein